MNTLQPRAVLVVEDDRSLSRILSLVLSEAGLAVKAAATGQEALDVLANEPGDAVVLDLGLPDRKGGDVLHWLLARDGAPGWVVISALDKQDAQKRYGPLGPHFLAKPFDPWQLVTIVKQLVSGTTS